MKYFIAIAVLALVTVCLGAPQGTATNKPKTPEECGPVLLIYLPVCGTDGVTYPNEDALLKYNCIMGLEGTPSEIKVAKKGECDRASQGLERNKRKTQEECGPVQLNLEPVCGTDGVTYPNEDVLRHHNCVMGLEGTPNEIKVAKEGECDRASQGLERNKRKTPEECGNVHRNYAPVCGTNGVTYANEDILRHHNCVRESEGTPNEIKVAKEGECDRASQGLERNKRKTQEECGPVQLNLEPVCGTDGVTYPNEDVLRHHNCVMESEGTPNEIKVAKEGECDRASQGLERNKRKTPEECGTVRGIYEPVCGTDGVTYGNEDMVWHHNCVMELEGTPDEIKVLKKGNCDGSPL